LQQASIWAKTPKTVQSAAQKAHNYLEVEITAVMMPRMKLVECGTKMGRSCRNDTINIFLAVYNFLVSLGE